MRARVDKARAQVFELIPDFRSSCFQRIAQRCVSTAERAAELVEMFVDHSFGFGECVGSVAIQALLDNLRHRSVQTIEEVLKLEAMFLQRLLMTPFHDCGARAGQDARLLTAKRFIHRAKLREISDLGRTSDVSRRW